MIAIHKITLQQHGINNIEIPSGAQVLRAGIQKGDVVVWFKVDDQRPLVNRKIMAVFTGEEFIIGDQFCEYVNTLQIQQQVKGKVGELVVHFFDLGEGPKIILGH